MLNGSQSQLLELAGRLLFFIRLVSDDISVSGSIFRMFNKELFFSGLTLDHFSVSIQGVTGTRMVP
jgi:hypothetical protein